MVSLFAFLVAAFHGQCFTIPQVLILFQFFLCQDAGKQYGTEGFICQKSNPVAYNLFSPKKKIKLTFMQGKNMARLLFVP